MSLRSIAANLGLSVTTVSRALADYADVAEETRRRVKAEAERIGYVPNATARRLQKGRADAIGVAAPSGFGAFEDSHLSSGFVGAWTRLTEFDQDLVLLPTDEGRAGISGTGPPLTPFRRAIEERRVDGMLIMRPRRDDPRIEPMLRAGLPFVLLDADPDRRPELPAIGSDASEAARLICERLTGLGHDRFVAIGPEEDFEFSEARFEGLATQAVRHGLDFTPVRAPIGESGGRHATERVLERRHHPPPPLVYLTNRMTVGGLTALAHTPWVIGRHVSVIGFGDSPALRHGLPATTVMQSPIFEMARHAIDALMAMREGRRFELVRRWTPTLELRRSDAPPDGPHRDER